MARTLKQAVKELALKGHTTIRHSLLTQHYDGNPAILKWDFRNHGISVEVKWICSDWWSVRKAKND